MNDNEEDPAIERDLQLTEAQEKIAVLEKALEEATAAGAAARRDADWQSDNARLAAEEMQHFVYAVSHDLRQPLRGVLTSAQLLERQADLRERTQEFTSAIIQGAVEMNGLIERLLTYSRVASNLRRTVVSLSPIVQWALMSMGKTVTEAEAEITCGDLPTVDVDDSTFATLFQQLFTNSILYRGAGKPKVHVSAEEADTGHVISVQDNGCGIKAEFHEKIFTPFQRLHGSEIPGFGLGLAISRKIVHAHGGRIWVESDGVHGCNFRFSIPA